VEELEPVWVCCGLRTPPAAHSNRFQLFLWKRVCATCRSVSRDVPERLFGRTIGADTMYLHTAFVGKCRDAVPTVTELPLDCTRTSDSYYALSQNLIKRLLDSSCLFIRSPVRPSVRMEQLGSHWTGFFMKFDFRVFFQNLEKIQVTITSEKNNGHFTWRPMYICDSISINSS